MCELINVHSQNQILIKNIKNGETPKEFLRFLP